jgi:hypothetical protein
MFAAGVEDDRLALALQIDDEPYKASSPTAVATPGKPGNNIL